MSRPRPLIGGVFGLEEADGTGAGGPFSGVTGRVLLLANARSGVWIVDQQLRPAQIWMPSYLCSSMLDGVSDRSRLRYYDVDDRLKAAAPRWIDEVNRGDLVVFIDYFGFPGDRTAQRAVKQRGAWVLEDACQALFVEPRWDVTDFVLYSARKFVGVPDGGILVAPSDGPLGEIALSAPPDEWWFTSFRSTLIRRDFDGGSERRDWFDLFQRAEASVPTGPYAMSTLSSAIVSRLDASRVVRRRRDNYAFLLARLGRWALFPELPDGVVPLGFPIRTLRRDEVRQRLFADEIFPPVHWPLAGVVPAKHEQSHRLSAEIMTLPCDQRYDLADMSRIADVSLRALSQATNQEPT